MACLAYERCLAGIFRATTLKTPLPTWACARQKAPRQGRPFRSSACCDPSGAAWKPPAPSQQLPTAARTPASTLTSTLAVATSHTPHSPPRQTHPLATPPHSLTGHHIMLACWPPYYTLSLAANPHQLAIAAHPTALTLWPPHHTHSLAAAALDTYTCRYCARLSSKSSVRSTTLSSHLSMSGSLRSSQARSCMRIGPTHASVPSCKCMLGPMQQLSIGR